MTVRRNTLQKMKSFPDLLVHTLGSSMNVHMLRSLFNLGVSDQGQLQSVRKPHSTDSVEWYFCCNFSSYFSVKVYKTFIVAYSQ